MQLSRDFEYMSAVLAGVCRRVFAVLNCRSLTWPEPALFIRNQRGKRPCHFNRASYPLIAATSVKPQCPKLFLDLPDAHRRCIALLNAELNGFAKRIDQLIPAVAAGDSPAHTRLLR
jgi:hypothetical protein